MEGFWEHIIVVTAARYSVFVLCTLVFLAVFELVTSYKNWEEIKKATLLLQWQREESCLGLQQFFVIPLNTMILCCNLLDGVYMALFYY